MTWATLNRSTKIKKKPDILFKSFISGQQSFAGKLLPADVVLLPVKEILAVLRARFGDEFEQGFNPDANISTPITQSNSTAWLKTARTVGINVRTIGSFWKVIPYSFTLPAAQNAIHLLPIWEPGVVASLYGPASWNINPEFYSPELATEMPWLNTVEKQLKVVVNWLHLMGRAVGMDVVPHADRFSEMVCVNPGHFEWLLRRDIEIVDHSAGLHSYAEFAIFDFLKRTGPASNLWAMPVSAEQFFSSQVSENQRLELLFGKKEDYTQRLERRKLLVDFLFRRGFETVPATMGPPYRGLEINVGESAKTVDEAGHVWRDFQITKPQKFSRAFGPLTRYRLYESLQDNENWQLDFSKPRPETWEYVAEHYAAVQREFDFDFMRGDMSHVQMRPEGVPAGAENDPFYDLLGAVKKRIQAQKPSFGYFAESFLAPPGEMAYGDECDHLEASHADSTLGDLQNEPVGSQRFMEMFSNYVGWNETRSFAPNFTILTADKDDPRFDPFYLNGNEIRYFISLFLTDMPSYMALGFECRDLHPWPAPNEHYSKLYVFQEKIGPKATRGPFVWGKNRRLYNGLTRQKKLADQIFGEIKAAKTTWIFRPDPTAVSKIIAWTQAENPRFLFVANLDCELESPAIALPSAGLGECLKPIFSTDKKVEIGDNRLIVNGLFQIGSLGKGEGRVFEIGF